MVRVGGCMVLVTVVVGGHRGCWFDTEIYINLFGLGLAMVTTIPPPNNLVSNFLQYI